jgi:predicted transcriptional regulator
MPPAGVTKTTVYLSTADYRRLQKMAEVLERPAAELVREAVAEYAARHAPRRRLPRSLGAGRSRRGNVGTRAEALLAGMGRRR